MTTEQEPKNHIYHEYNCKRTTKLSVSYQIRPYYEGSEQLEVLLVCPDCGAYEFRPFDEYKRDLNSNM